MCRSEVTEPVQYGKGKPQLVKYWSKHPSAVIRIP